MRGCLKEINYLLALAVLVFKGVLLSVFIIALLCLMGHDCISNKFTQIVQNDILHLISTCFLSLLRDLNVYDLSFAINPIQQEEYLDGFYKGGIAWSGYGILAALLVFCVSCKNNPNWLISWMIAILLDGVLVGIVFYYVFKHDLYTEKPYNTTQPISIASCAGSCALLLVMFILAVMFYRQLKRLKCRTRMYGEAYEFTQMPPHP